MQDDMENNIRDMFNPQELALALLASLALMSLLYIISTYSEPWPEWEGYYTFGQECRRDSDCECKLVHGEFDTCGRAGEYPACVGGKCDLKFDLGRGVIESREFQKKAGEDGNGGRKLFPSS